MKKKLGRKPRKIYKTVIKLSPGSSGTTPNAEPEIEIDTVTLRPKLIDKFSKPGKPNKLDKLVKPSRHIKPTRPARLEPGQLRSSLVQPKQTVQLDGSQLKIAKRYDEALIQRMEWEPVTAKTRWKCMQCGWCCSHEWRVNLTWDEYDRLKDKLPIDEMVLDKKTGMSHPFYMIKDKCVQLDEKTKKCKIYKERSYSCATYPFAITPDGKLVKSKYCKGFGNGKLVDEKKMKEYIYKCRKRAGMIV